MKLLLDQNLSPHLVRRLGDLWPVEHVDVVGLGRAPDSDVRAYALANGFTLVTKDADFSDLLFLRGFPPRVVWLRLGNCTTDEVERAIRLHADALRALHADPLRGLLELHRA